MITMTIFKTVNSLNLMLNSMLTLGILSVLLASVTLHSLVVVEGNSPPLLGHSWLQKLRLPWNKMFEVNSVHNDQALPSVLWQFNSVFCNATGLLQDVTLHFEYDKSVSPEFYKHRSPAWRTFHKAWLISGLPYGINSAVSWFQHTMGNLLKALPGVTVFLDNILVTWKTSGEHVQNLRAVLQRLSDNGLKLCQGKCQFFLPAVEYLGLRISADGVQPTLSTVCAIKEAPRPQTVSELHSFLGIVNHYAKFLPHVAHHLTPLSDRLGADQDWVWGKSQEAAFCIVRDMISEDLLLSHYYMDSS